MEKKYGKQGLVVIGVHTPEFDFEKERSRVEASVKKYNKTSPVFMDNDYSYWKALGNRYWPTFYLVDKKGIIRGRIQGEINIGSREAEQGEQAIRSLLKE